MMGRLGDYRRLDRLRADNEDGFGQPPIGDSLKGDTMTPENVGILARMLIERRDLARSQGDRLRTVQREQDRARDEGAAYLEGSAAAYGVACSIVAALMMEPDIETVARIGDAPPLTPSAVSDPLATIRAAVDLDANRGRGAVIDDSITGSLDGGDFDLADGDHFAGIPS